MFSTNHIITPGECDYEGRLGLFDTFRLFQDLAGAHCYSLGADQPTVMKKGFFWLVAKTRFHFYERPKMAEEVQISTWAMNMKSHTSDRCYKMTNKSKILIEGKTEWAFLNINSGSLEKMQNVIDSDFPIFEEDVSFGSIPRFSLTENQKQIGTYKVTSMDIDVGNHMNNVAYIRAFLSLFPISSLTENKIQDISILYRNPAHEGDNLSITEDKTPNGKVFGLMLEENKPAAVILLN